MIKNAVTLEAVHTLYFYKQREEVRLLFKPISYLFNTSCKGGKKLVGGLIE